MSAAQGEGVGRRRTEVGRALAPADRLVHPGQHRGPAVGVQNDTGGELVRGSEQHDVDASALERADVEAVRVDGNRYDLEAGGDELLARAAVADPRPRCGAARDR